MPHIIINGLTTEEVETLSAKALAAGHQDGDGNPHWAKYFEVANKLQPEASAPTQTEEVIS